MCEVNIYEAKTNLSKYIEKLERGEEEEIVICRFNKPVATISLYKKKKKKTSLHLFLDPNGYHPFPPLPSQPNIINYRYF